MHFDVKKFAQFMQPKFGINIIESEVGEESVLLYKQELDENLVSKRLLELTPELVLIHTYDYVTEDNEWVVCVASDVDTNYPLFLICLKDGSRVYEEVLNRDSF